MRLQALLGKMYLQRSAAGVGAVRAKWSIIVHRKIRGGGVAMYDMKNLKKLAALEASAPEAVKAFWAFDKAAMAAGAIPVKYKELMALAVAFTTQCPYCIEIHAGKAREAGASEQEISEVVVIAAALRAGAAITHGTHALK
jgi:AhpD family alkylhydroperoxidase